MIVKILLCSAFYVLFFSNLANLELQFLSLGVGLLCVSAIVAVVSDQARRLPLSPWEVMMVCLTTSSAIVGAIHSSETVIVYSFAFSLVFLAVGILRRSVTIEEILMVCGIAFALNILTALVFYSNDYLVGLTGEASLQTGLLRFRPFNLHPNLTGFTYGIGAIVLLFCGEKSKGVKRTFFFLFSFLSLSFVVAASARAGMLAFAISVIFFVVSGLRLKNQRMNTVRMIILIVCISVMLIVFLMNYNYIEQYAVLILDLNNPLRGLGSGATGRSDVWRMSLQELNERNFSEIIFGTGIRSSSFEEIGYHVESSYFTILLDSGIPLASFIFLSLVVTVVTYSIASRSSGILAAILACIIVFAMTQSVFNRYLIAIGNPASLLLLFIFSATAFQSPRHLSDLRFFSKRRDGQMFVARKN